MSSLQEIHTDSRQTPQWGEYMKSLQWKTERIDDVSIAIRQVYPFKHSIAKVAHQKKNPPFAELDRLAKENKIMFTLIEPHTINYNPQEYKENGYIVSKIKSSIKTTRLIDLRPTEPQIFDSFSENARRNIKKAQKSDIEVKNIMLSDPANQHYFDTFHKMYSNLGKQKKFYTQPYEESYHKMAAFKDSTMLTMAFQKGSDQPIAAVWYAWFDKTIAYFHTGITQEGYDLHANYLLVWEGIKYAKTLGLEVFDFEGVFDNRTPRENKKWKGYSEFKQRFHGELLEYPDTWIKLYNIPYKIFYLCATTIFPSL